MFKRHSIQMKVVKTPKTPTNNAIIVSDMDPEKLAELYKDVLKHTSITVVSMVAATYVLKTISEIAINIAPKN